MDDPTLFAEDKYIHRENTEHSNGQRTNQI